MTQATRLIIESGNSIVFIRRVKEIAGEMKEFYVLPGGELEENETWEEAGIREAKEELDVVVELESLLVEEEVKKLNKLERYYFAKVVSGKIKNGKGEEFSNPDFKKYGSYEVVKLSKKELGAYNILPTDIKDLLVATYV